jgi:membrane protein DedA with SNARE-associated domain
VSLLVPSTVLFLGISSLIEACGQEFWPIWLGAAVGAILGDWLSFAIGCGFKHDVLALSQTRIEVNGWCQLTS